MDLEKKVKETYDLIYKKKFGILFIRSFVIAFRISTQSARLTTTEAEVGLEFSKTTTSENLPKNEVVQETLREAINSTTFNVTFIPNTINIINSPLTTTAPSTNSSITAITANTTTTPTTPTTVESTIRRRLTFRTEETFTTDLLNLSSTAFRNRAALLKSNLEPFYRNVFPSLRNFTVISFSNGSIVNNIDLKFATASAPNETQIVDVLVKAVSNITVFVIDKGSIVVDVTYPENAKGFRASSQDETSITLQWNKINNKISFVLQFNGTETFISAPEGDGPVNYTVSSLSPGTNYTFTLFSVFDNIRSRGVQLTAATASKNAYASIFYI
ncbi:chitinase-like protein PB1E7.04c [Xiphophorus hellerii]|uniref:chitinase-like protein PB1E7.04c n=1 Tax=Xiphophorus hellerii TaxID=8084 RepID=UPI0013B38A56|nr:chitinase-like protein PB1E7.04c [Xiphophorus hellerii]